MATPITTVAASDSGTVVVDAINANSARRMWPYVVSITAHYTVLTADSYSILADATSGAITVTLPAAASSTNVRVTVKKTDAGGNAVTLDGNASETIDGATTHALSAQWDAVTIVCNGTAWFIESAV